MFFQEELRKKHKAGYQTSYAVQKPYDSLPFVSLNPFIFLDKNVLVIFLPSFWKGRESFNLSN